jgi:CDP-diacylglycerol--glycerol-3-phosphate 3-phosphatidyltransferase
MSTGTVSAPLRQLPNALTVLRFLAIPIFAVLFLAAGDGPAWGAGLLFAAAAVTDQLDGWLARRWRVESQFGKIADPLADRLMIDAAVILLWLEDRLPWVALLIPLRDFVLVVGYPLVARRGYDFNVNLAGKAATWLLYASLALLMVTHDGTDWPLWIFWAGVGLAVAAGAQYIVTALRTVRR